MALDILYLLGGLLVGGVVAWLLVRQRQTISSPDTAKVVSELERHMVDRLDRVTEQLDLRLRENVRAMNESKSFLANRVSTTERAVREVSSSLGKLEQATTALQATTKEINSFQQLLRSPKVRGSFGEMLLGNLLGEVLPSDRFALQYAIRTTGEIADAVIMLQDNYIVAVDAKFPYANYEAYHREQDAVQKKNLRSLFIRDVKKHVLDIGRKYVSPADRTLDYAFMYIPAEGVYYETIVRDGVGDGLWEFCVQNHVVPVSPNSFLAYLHTILIGLRGMKIEQQAKEILEHLSQVRRDFGRFADDFTMVGKHITNAKNRFDDSARALDKFANRLEQIDSDVSIQREQLPE